MEPFSPPPGVSQAFARRFLQRCEELAERAASVEQGRCVLPFAEFMQLALYDPKVGYYTAPVGALVGRPVPDRERALPEESQTRARVGHRPGTDFYTASSMHTVFGPLVVAAAANLVGADRAGEFTFVEIGAEPGAGVLDHTSHAFANAQCIRLSEPISIPERAIVFSNELFDAQPFSRVTFRGGAWREVGVRFDETARKLDWCELHALTPEVASVLERLPPQTTEGYTIDLPLAAERLAREIAGQNWAGLFLAFDYGRSWEALCQGFPQGTGRGYRAHRHAASLLDFPGEQDLTCHVCWDWLEHALDDAGFAPVERAGQERFFIQHAADAINGIVAGHPSPLSAERSQLKQLIHPALMGQRFEALYARRGR